MEVSKWTRLAFLRYAGACRQNARREINNACIWSAVALESLGNSLNDPSFLERQRYTVPSVKSRKTVKRSRDDVERIIHTAADTHLYHAVFVYLVAHVEACLADLLRNVLIRIREHQVSGRRNQAFEVVEIDAIIDCESHSSLIERIVDSELVNVFYASPKAQLTYLEKVLGIDLDDATKGTWREIKATRDIIVHNSGVVNDTYLAKTGTFARGVPGDELVVDKEYFERSAAAMKSLVGRVCSRFQADIRKNLRETAQTDEGKVSAG